jgi:hypothetical protein
MKNSRYLLGSILLWIIFPLAMLSLAPQAHAAGPYVFCEVTSPAADACVVTGHPTLNGEYPISNAVHQGRRGALIDAAGVPSGLNGLSVAAKSNLWGVLGVAVPFSFSRPTSADLTPAVIELIRQPL